MKKLLALILALIPYSALCQTSEFNDMKTTEGLIIKYTDTRMEPILLEREGLLVTMVRYSYNLNQYQCCIRQRYDRYTHTEIINYKTLVELNKALDRMIVEANSDIATNANFIRNKYRTEDGFIVGYDIESGVCRWYIDFCEEEYDHCRYIRSGEQIASVLKSIQTKIERLQSK